MVEGDLEVVTVRGRIRGDLARFQELIEQRGEETGAWRGEVHGGEIRGGDAWPPTSP